MDFNTILQAVSAVGFPIVFCVLVYKTMVESINKFNEKLSEIMKQHSEEAKTMQKSLDDNTSVILRLLDKMGGDRDDEA